MQLSALGGFRPAPLLSGRTIAYTSHAWVMKNEKGKTVKKQDLPSKTCAACGRPFTWRKKWERCWDEVNERCRRSRSVATQAVASGSMAATVEAQPIPQAGTQVAADNSLRSQDLGMVVHLEHLNLEVPDTLLAERFYAQGLGLTADPGSTGSQRGGVRVTWYNIGKQQFHISPGPEPQRTPLPVKLVLPDHADMLKRLRLVKPQLEGTQFGYEQKEGYIRVTDPWGQVFEVQPPAEGLPYDRGIKDIRLPVACGTAAAIGKFYEKMYMAQVTHSKQQDAVCASVHFGPSTTVTFEDTADLPSSQAAVHSFEGWHLALYVANFSSVYSAVKAAGLNLLDHKYNDKSPTLEDALKWSQFRMQDIIALEDSPEGNPSQYGKGDVLYRFGHEVRSLYHPRYLRPLYNRGLNVYDDHGPDLVD